MSVQAKEMTMRLPNHLWRTKQYHRLVLLVPLLLLALAAPAITWAHPLGNFTVNRYSRLELVPGAITVFYVLDLAEIPAFQAIQQIDQNDDGTVAPEESAVYARAKADEVRQNLQLTLDAKPVDLTPVGAPELTFPAGQGGLSLLRLTFTLAGTLPASSQGAINADYRDTNEPDRIGWREIVVRGRDGLRLLESTVSDQDQSDELRSYPQDTLARPLNQTSAQFAFEASPLPYTSLPLAPRELGAASNDGAFAALITLPQLDVPVVLLALATALGLGALHALEPGHGKTAAAAYLVGARATARHAVVLGLTITGMHTSSVFVLGIVTLFASRFVLPERLFPWLGLASGLIVIGMGLHMFISRLWSGSHRTAQEHHMHLDDHPLDHVHSHGGHSHHHGALTQSSGPLGWRGVLAIGVSGGLLPCPAALVVLLSAIGLGRVGFGLLLIVAFSAGLALVLSGIGLAVLYGGRWLERRATQYPWIASRRIAQLSTLVPALTGLMVVAAGILLLYHALPLLRIWQT
jgi:nickel/cobalt transporter (NicO) family protein